VTLHWSEPPSYMTIDGTVKTKPVVSVVNAPVGKVTIYFWSTDIWGASSESTPVTFTFVEVKERQKLIIETYPPAFGAAATNTTLQLFDVSGLLAQNDDMNNPNVPFDHRPSAMIVYLLPEDFSSNTVLLANIYSSSGNEGAYSIRVFTLPESAILPDDLPDYVYSGIPANDLDNPYEDLEAALDSDPWNDVYDPGAGPVTASFDPAIPLHRSLSNAHDVDWIKIVIP
jgi:hypothetical protein